MLSPTIIEADTETLNADGDETCSEVGSREVVVTIAFHPDLERVGDQLVVGVDGAISVSRHQGFFSGPNGEGPLGDPYVSRQPLRMTVDWRRGVSFACATSGAVVVADHSLTTPICMPLCDIERGVVVTLSNRIVLLVHLGQAGQSTSDHGLVGGSSALQAIRANIDQVADLDVPVLLRGETGAGKDMVARALHAGSDRAHKPYVAVNMGAISPATAASELFGHARGAFTGATNNHVGLFERADGGTIFLDEIGETPDEIQPMLLRVLETQEFLPVGASEPRRTNVRVIAATDADLESALRAGSFRSALLHRLSGFEIQIAPVRRRREDIAPLVVHFMKSELAKLDQSGKLEQNETERKLWFRPKLMRLLLRYDWPGNVRQLLNAVRQLLITSRNKEVLTLDARLDDMLRGKTEPSSPACDSVPRAPRPSELSDEVVAAALQSNRFSMGPTAKSLGVPRSTLYDFIEKSKQLRTAKDVEADELRQSFSDHEGDLDAMSNALQVSKRGIRLRLGEIGVLD